MPGGNKNIKPEDNTGGFHKNPQNINRQGRPKVKPLREMINESQDEYGNTILDVPKKECKDIMKDGEEYVRIYLPNRENIMKNLQEKAAKDVRWFDSYAKIMGEYAPVKTEDVSKVKEIAVKIINTKEND